VIAGGKGSRQAGVLDVTPAATRQRRWARPERPSTWLGRPRLVRQTGKTVTPEVYVAAGVSSSASRHEEVGSAINKDEAPLMKMADLGVVGDVATVVPALTEEIRRRAGS
jgi:electron transfer flavoprotein alpha subunit